MAARITLLIEEPKWKRPASLAPKLKKAAMAALRSAGKGRRGGVTILLTGDDRLKQLNREFRGKNKATNVLSFPAPDESYLGDIAIAWGVSMREAGQTGKSMPDHACHLAVHGMLHLLGYDHETDKDAKVMEPLEVKILKGLGIADPYRVRI